MYDDDVINDMDERMDELVGLTKTKKEASARNVKLQFQANLLYDWKEMERKFEPKDIVLMGNARIEDKGKHEKFDPIQLDPYLVDSTWGEDFYILKELSGIDILEFPVYGQLLQRYFC